ncbi:MAG TPA: glycosyltransferase family A protein, partial [Polyangiaceae bacterium]
MPPFLTIAIPTRNRSPFLRECLDSIRGQKEGIDRIEVVVSDNASTDDTAEVIEALRRSGLPIRYSLHEEDVGFDRNFEHVVSLARGEYTWALGDDDRLEPGGLAAVLQLLAAHPNAAGLTIESAFFRVDGSPIDSPPGTDEVRAFSPARSALLDRDVPHRLCNMTLNVFRTDLAQESVRDHPLARNSCAA